MDEATKPLAILLADHFADWEFGALSGPGVGFYGRRVVWASPGGKTVRSMGGLQVVPDLALDQIYPRDCAALVLVGGGSWLGEDLPDVAQTVRDFLEAGAVVAGICGGTVGLARSGVLDDVAHTSNAPDFLTDRAPSYRGQSFYRDQPAALRDGRVITAPGSAPASFAAEVLSAVGVPEDKTDELRLMLASEHD